MKVGIRERRATSGNGERSNDDGDRGSEDSNVRKSESVEKATILALERRGRGLAIVDEGTRKKGKDREGKEGARGWREERISVLWMGVWYA